jgi:hypothetical protein
MKDYDPDALLILRRIALETFLQSVIQYHYIKNGELPKELVVDGTELPYLTYNIVGGCVKLAYPSTPSEDLIPFMSGSDVFFYGVKYTSEVKPDGPLTPINIPLSMHQLEFLKKNFELDWLRYKRQKADSNTMNPELILDEILWDDVKVSAAVVYLKVLSNHILSDYVKDTNRVLYLLGECRISLEPTDEFGLGIRVKYEDKNMTEINNGKHRVLVDHHVNEADYPRSTITQRNVRRIVYTAKSVRCRDVNIQGEVAEVSKMYKRSSNDLKMFCPYPGLSRIEWLGVKNAVSAISIPGLNWDSAIRCSRVFQ